ncbi:hypothetical protein FB451DRAFT_1567122 [Mycena latifolia]|nr:hypothetical protein FB451DRAFT_1567122 [Mycena latifolia]
MRTGRPMTHCMFAQTGISMGVIESFKKYEELDVRRAEEIELRKSTAVPRNACNKVSQRYANRTTRQTRNSDKARRAHAADSNIAALQAELLEMKEELTAARGDAKVSIYLCGPSYDSNILTQAEPSADAAQRVRELEAAAVGLEGKLKLTKAEAKSSSSGRVRAPKAGVGATTLNVTAPTANDVGPALGATAALPMPMSSEFLTSAPTAAEGGSDVADVRRLSARNRTQADLSGTARVSSNKRQKKLEDPLAGWVMQDPDAGEKLTGHEWVERNPEEFAQRYKKDHQRYLQYLAQSVDS